MPWIQVHEGHEEVETNRCRSRDNEVGKNVGTDRLFRLRILELDNDNVEGSEGSVSHDDTIHDHTPEEHLLGTLGSVTHRQDELHADEQRACVAEDVEDVFSDVVAEGI